MGKNSNQNNNKRQSNVSFNKGFKDNKPKEKVNGGVFIYSEPLSVQKLAESLGLLPSEIIKYLFMNGKMVTMNTILEDDLIGEVCLNFDYDFKKEKVVSASNFEDLEIIDDEKDLESRPPIVTIMGHVDHGKTTLLDTIRKSKVAAGEAGGITQAIGAYSVSIKGKKITFLDTPGHAAFSAMRARGSQVTDVVIIVVAADDGVKPQTIEAVDHAKAANVPIIVAVNKIDKPGVNPERVKTELADLGLMPEEWGGNTVFCNISAKQNIGIDDLLENILLIAELQELKANPNRYAIGSVIEATLDKGLGPVATLLVQNGTLNVGDCVVVGPYFGKVRQMFNDQNLLVKEAGPSAAVLVSGLSDVPEAGDKFMAFKDEKQARDAADERLKRKIEKDRQVSSSMSLDDLYGKLQQGESSIKVIIKADSSGSAEAVKGALEKIKMEDVTIDVIRFQSGAITESDVILADASKAIIYGFNVRPDANIKKLAEEKHIDIRLHRVIYDLIEEIELAMKGKLKPEIKEVVSGQLEVRQLFKVSKVGTIAGCYVTTGFIKADSLIRLIRNGIVIYEGRLGSLQRFQQQAKEVKEGYECGCTIENYNDLSVGDIIEGYYNEEVKK